MALAVADRRGVALRAAIDVWAASSTSGTTRRREELIAKKRKVVENFFANTGKDPGEVTPPDVQAWCDGMRREDGRRPSPATLYARVSFLSSFYAWAQRELGLRANPAGAPDIAAIAALPPRTAGGSVSARTTEVCSSATARWAG